MIFGSALGGGGIFWPGNGGRFDLGGGGGGGGGIPFFISFKC